MEINDLLVHLVENIFKGRSNVELERYIGICEAYCNAQLQVSSPHSIRSWSSKWKKQIKQQNIKDFDFICKKLPQDRIQIYKLLDLLKFSPKKFVVTKLNPESSKVTTKSKHFLSENQLVKELVVLLQGGKSEIITYHSESYMIDGLLFPQHAACVQKIMACCLCINTLNYIQGKLYGIVGQAVESVLQKEKNAYITEMLSANNEISLLNLVAFACGSAKLRLEASAVIAYAIINSNEEDDIFMILKTASSHGSPAVDQVAKLCFEEAKNVYTDIIRDWVLYGSLADPYNEFFVIENEEDIKSCDWWDNQYYIEPLRIPSFIKSDTIASQITSCGRAWNFIRHFKRIAMEGGGVRASLMLNTPTESVEKKFNLKELPKYTNESMKNVLNIVKNIIWLPGHVKTITDFILLRRGDFAVSLFEHFLHEGSPISLLDHVLREVCQDNEYKNRLTHQNTTVCIDVKMTARNEIDNSPEAVILYYNAPNDLTYVFDDSIVDSYVQVGRLVWSLKCCERRLLLNWSNSRNSMSSFAKIDLSDTNIVQSALRFAMINTIRAISEFITTDVISVIQRDLISGMEKAETIDALLSLIRTRASQLKRDTFINADTQKFREFQASLSTLVNSISEYNIIEEDFHGALFELEDMLADNSADFTKLMRNYREIRSEFNFNVAKSKDAYEDALRDLYELTLETPELWMLESRLQFCVANIIKK